MFSKSEAPLLVVLVSAVVLVLAGCNDTGLLNALGKKDDPRQKSSDCEMVEPGKVGVGTTYDDLLAEVAEETPGGFGGSFLDGETLVIYLKEAENQEAAREVQAKLAEVLGRPEFADYSIRIRKAQYDFAQLNRWKELSGRIFGLPGVNMQDIDESRNLLQFGVEPAPENTTFEAVRECVMENVENLGIPREAVRVIKAGAPEDRPG